MPPCHITAGRMRITVDDRGRVVELVDRETGRNQLFPRRESVLLTLLPFEASAALTPIRMRVDSQTSSGCVLLLEYECGFSARMEVVERETHARLTLAAVEPVEQVAEIRWGPVRTDMEEPLGEYLGMLRGDGVSFGLLGLEPNTDGMSADHRCPFTVARFHADGVGACVEAVAQDHAHDRRDVGPKYLDVRGEPGNTVVGSAVALFGCDPTAELDAVEAVELAEGLPHPLIDGEWSKRSSAATGVALWIDFDETNATERIELARRMGASTICSFIRMFGNWGHFVPDPEMYPSGMDGVRDVVRTAADAGVDVVMYTLTGFLKPKTVPEPFIAPVPDPRLQVTGPPTVLARDAAAEDDVLVLEKREGLLEMLEDSPVFGHWIRDRELNRALRVGDELVHYASVRERGDTLALEGCVRGVFDTLPAAHARGTGARRMLLAGYRNFYPGTLDMLDDLARNIARVALDGGFGQIIFDGHESCYETGHGNYARHRLTRLVYETCGSNVRRYSGSCYGHWDWHIQTFKSWGEWDRGKGFRGSMLDYRLRRQVQHERNLMPRGMGQYYPDDATLEDIEWLMARAAGWDAGVDLHVLDADAFDARPDRDALLDAVVLWNEARVSGAFTEKQKLGLRRTDALYTLSRTDAGEWDLRFVRHWRHEDVEMLPPDVFGIEAASPGASVAGPSIDFSATRNPALYDRAGLSADLVCPAGETGAWTVTYPGAVDDPEDRLQFVLRLSPDASCAVRDPQVVLDGTERVAIPVTLEPGQYVSTVHDTPLVCVCDADQNVVAEAHIRHRLMELPRVTRGAPHRVEVRAEPVAPHGEGELLFNLRTHVPVGEAIRIATRRGNQRAKGGPA